MKKTYLISLILFYYITSYGQQSETIDVNGHGQGLTISNSADNAGTYISLLDHDGKKANIASFDNNYSDTNFRNALQFFARNGKDFRFATSSGGNAGSNKFVILNNGHVGIGTENPLQDLQLGNSWVFHSGGAKVIGYNASYASGNQKMIDGYSSGISFSSSGNMYFNVSPYGNAGDDVDWTHAMTIANNGEVGLGTLSPKAQLHVNGDLYLESDESYESGWGITRFNWKGHSLIMGTKPGRYAHNKIELKPGGSSTGLVKTSLEMYDATNEDEHELKVRVSSTGKSYFNGGYVGIGTTNPDHKLTVKGTIHAEEVLVDLNVPGPDYVFEEDYSLQDLSSLEEYLKANKHLPEVPSASEMKEEGIKVGEMEMLLLKKVEELTLHIIKLEKRIKELEK